MGFRIAIITFSLLLQLFTLTASAQESRKPENVLYLNSYAPTYSWTDSMTLAIKRAFSSRPEIQLYIEYLDAKRFGKNFFDEQYRFLQKKYSGLHFKVIITSDNDALEFCLRYGDDLFPAIPVVFGGVNNPMDYPLEDSRYYGILEAVDQDSVNQLILQIMPGIRKLYFFNDSTHTSQINLRYVRQLEPRYKDRVEFVYFGNYGQDSLLKLVSTLEKDNAIALFDIFQDPEKRPINPDILLQQIAKVSSVPVFMDSDPSFGKGIVGGILNKGSVHGSDLAQLAMRFIDDPGFVPAVRVAPPKNHSYFDYRVLKRYHIDILNIPPDATIINTPQKTVVYYLKLIGGLLILILILLSVISVMMINIRRRKNAEALVKLKFSEIEEKNTNLEKAHRSISSLLEEMETKNENLSELNRQLDRARVLAEESDKLKTTFLHNMSHEIRTPMNAIIGFSSLLLDENSIEKKRNYIDIIEANSRNLLVLINNILDLSKMQTSRIELYPAPCRLPELLERMVQSFVPECKDKGLVIRLTKTELPADLIIHADEVKLEQVLNNLLSNAVKYTRKGSIDLGVRRLPSEILFYVKDTGIGIPSGTGEKIFEQFYRIEDTSLEIYRGTGLGLAICRSLVSLWNGKIWYESQQGTGTTFFFTLPYAVLAAQTNSNNRAKDTVHDWSGRCFIIAEDEDSNFQLLKSYLDPTGAELLHARTGVEAIHLAMQRPVDLVLMDIKMPVLNGKDALKQMREKKLSLPVIAQTAYAFTDEVDQLLKCGFNAILTKPIQKSTLFDQIVQNLQNPGKDPIK